jgi:hypothetical protein
LLLGVRVHDDELEIVDLATIVYKLRKFAFRKEIFNMEKKRQ